MKHIDLFTGIGGMTLALIGVSRPVLYCDKKPSAQAVLTKLMREKQLPSAPIVKDIYELSRECCPKADIVTAGFPCQGFSLAGDRTGFHHAESAVFAQLLKVCEAAQPTAVFLENSQIVYTDTKHRQRVERAFAKMGYAMHHCVVSANEVGLPHKRSRWFALALKPTFTKQAARKMSARLKLLPKCKEPSRTVRKNDPTGNLRYNLLKNSVVPNAAVLALQKLLSQYQSDRVFVMPEAQTPDFELKFQQGGIVYRKKMWPTPHGAWFSGSPTLNERNSRDLPTAIKYEQHTSVGTISIEWVEWLMGYNTGWTRPS